MGKFFKNTLFTFASSIFNFVLVLGSSVIIARTLGPEGKGIYALVFLLPAFLMALINIGFGSASVYFIGQKKYPIKEVFGNNVIFFFLTAILTVLIGLMVVFFFGEKLFPGVAQEYLFLGLSFIPVIIFLNFVSSILLGLQKIKEYNIIAILLKDAVFLFLIAIFLLGMGQGIKTAIIVEFISFSVVCFVLFLWVKKQVGGICFKINKLYFKDALLYGSKVYLGNLFSFLRQKIDMFLLNIFLSPFFVGLYSIAKGFSEKIWVISSSAALVLFPRVSSETDKERLKSFTPLVCRNVLLITLLGAVIIAFFSEHLVRFFYSEVFLGAVRPLNILLIGVVAISVGMILGNDISGRGKPMVNTYITLVSLIISIILLIILLPKLGMEGAAWAFSISSLISALIVIAVYSRISGNKVRDIIFIKKSDLLFYQNFLILLKDKSLNFLKK